MVAHVKPTIELRDLDVLLAVAEVGSFRGAATAFGLEPSAVSRRIRSLEDRLGASLFERSRSGVRLTHAGRRFHDDARGAIERVNGAVRSVLTAGRAGNGRVAIGVVGSLSSRYLGQLIGKFRSEYPGVVLSVSEGSNHDHVAAITDKSLDLAFVLGTPRPVGCQSEHLWSESVVVALASDDIRTSQARLSFSSLCEDHFIVSCDSPGPEVHDFIIRSLSDPGSHPHISQYKVGREALILMVGLGFGTSLVCGSEMRLSFPNVTFVPLDGQEVSFSAIWLPNNDNPALRCLLSLARRLSNEEKGAVASRIPDPSP